jgi:hypothetical protein
MITLSFLREIFVRRSTIVEMNISLFSHLFPNFLAFFHILMTNPDFGSDFPRWTINLIIKGCVLLASANLPEIEVTVHNLLFDSPADSIRFGLCLLFRLFQYHPELPLVDMLETFTRNYFRNGINIIPTHYKIIQALIVIWEVAVSSNAGNFPTTILECQILAHILSTPYDCVALFQTAIKCASKFYQVFRHNSEQFQAYTNLIIQPMLDCCLWMPSIAGSESLFLCQEVLAVIQHYFSEYPIINLEQCLTISLLYLQLPPIDPENELENNPQYLWEIAYKIETPDWNSVSRVPAFALLQCCVQQFPEQTFEWLRSQQQQENEPLRFAFWGAAKVFGEAGLKPIREMSIPQDFFPQLTHWLMCSAYAQWSTKEEIETLQNVSFVLMQQITDPVQYSVGSSIMYALTFIENLQFPVEHIQLLWESMNSDLGMDCARILGTLMTRNPDFYVMEVICQKLSFEFTNFHNTSANSGFEKICANLTILLQSVPAKSPVIEILYGLFVNVVQNSDTVDLLVLLCPVIQLVIYRNPPEMDFVQVLIDRANEGEIDYSDYVHEFTKIFTAFVAAHPTHVRPEVVQRMIEITIDLCDQNDEETERQVVLVLLAAMVQGGILPVEAIETAIVRAQDLINHESQSFAAAFLLLGSIALRDENYFMVFINQQSMNIWMTEINRGTFSGKDLKVILLGLLDKMAAIGLNVEEIAQALAANQLPSDGGLEIMFDLPWTRMKGETL